MRAVKVYGEAWSLHTLFVITRGSRTEVYAVVVELTENGVTSVDECIPYPRYGGSDVSVLVQIINIAPQPENGLTREEL